MNRRELGKIGRGLYGNRWKTALARALGVHRLTVQRWADKRVPIPDEQAEKIRELEKVGA